MLKQSLRFEEELEIIVYFIALDSPARALEFFDAVISKIKKITLNPCMYRQKSGAKDNNTRELIFKGYTIPFYIDEKNHKIIILGVFNQNIWE